MIQGFQEKTALLVRAIGKSLLDEKANGVEPWRPDRKFVDGDWD